MLHGYNVKHVGPLLKGNCSKDMQIALNRNNDIIMIKHGDSRVYVFDNSGKLKHKFERDSNFLLHLSVSNKNEIIIPSHDRKAVNLYTEAENLTSTIKLPEDHFVMGVAFHYVVGKMIVLTYVVERKSLFLFYYSEASKLEFETFFCHRTGICPPNITSHPSGPVALVGEKSITFV